ncbi:MAG TPA: F0F1 ATP synthase subunit epsilon [Burkholderiaceae bacterium]|nr:F0F1 ATP synthase subunit epsilon [Burkholderiaceae bacterium]
MSTMRLKVLTPTRVLVDTPATKIVAEAANGYFCLLPRHVDFAAALVPGILYYTAETGEEALVAVDEGALVKCGAEVLVSALNAVAGTDLATLQATVADTFVTLDEDARRARSALARLESGVLRRLAALERAIHG